MERPRCPRQRMELRIGARPEDEGAGLYAGACGTWMRRTYVRVQKDQHWGFREMGWLCPTCGHFFLDSPPQDARYQEATPEEAAEGQADQAMMKKMSPLLAVLMLVAVTAKPLPRLAAQEAPPSVVHDMQRLREAIRALVALTLGDHDDIPDAFREAFENGEGGGADRLRADAARTGLQGEPRRWLHLRPWSLYPEPRLPAAACAGGLRPCRGSQRSG